MVVAVFCADCVDFFALETEYRGARTVKQGELLAHPLTRDHEIHTSIDSFAPKALTRVLEGKTRAFNRGLHCVPSRWPATN